MAKTASKVVDSLSEIDVAIAKDDSRKFDPVDWWVVYKDQLSLQGVSAESIDLSCDKWLTYLQSLAPRALLWRVWHRPDDLRDALTKIYICERDLGIQCFPGSNDLWSYNDKVRQLYLARKHGIQIPKTIATRSIDEARKFVTEIGYPVVSKAPMGACGTNITLINSPYEFEKHLEKVFSLNGLELYDPIERQRGIIYLQRFHQIDRDLRIITVGTDVVLAFWRKSSNWRHNISQGAKIDPSRIPSIPIQMCLRIAELLMFPWCAFDIIESEGQFLLLEFSVQFGFSSPPEYERHFGSWDGGVLRRQADLVARKLGYGRIL